MLHKATTKTMLVDGWFKGNMHFHHQPPFLALTSKKWVPQRSQCFNAWFFRMPSLLLSQNGLGVSGNERLGKDRGMLLCRNQPLVPWQKQMLSKYLG
jgi:hypothetical protein